VLNKVLPCYLAVLLTILLTTPAHADGILENAIKGMVVADAVSSRIAFRYPTLTEGNPLILTTKPILFEAQLAGSYLIERWAVGKIKNRKGATILRIVSLSFRGYVVYNNLKLIREAKELSQ
jgi:hypothetical protein